MIYGYIRVSTDKQTTENQRFEILKFAHEKKLSVDRWIEETISATKKLSDRKLGGLIGCDRAIPNPNLLIKSFAHKIKHLLKNIVLLYSPGFYANALDVGL